MLDKISKLCVREGLLLQKFQTLDIASFTRSRSYGAYFGVDLKSYNVLLFMRDAKSRFVMRDAEFLLSLASDISANLGKVVKKRVLFYNSQMCSKSAKFLKENGFSLHAFV